MREESAGIKEDNNKMGKAKHERKARRCFDKDIGKEGYKERNAT